MAKDFLLTPLTYLPGVGPRRAKALAEELDLYTYLDLLHYFPTKYVDRSRIYQIRELRGEMPHVELKGYIRDFKEVGEGRKKRLVAYFTDGTGTIELVWFRSMPYIRQRYIPGQWYLVFGKPSSSTAPTASATPRSMRSRRPHRSAVASCPSIPSPRSSPAQG